MSNVDPEFCSNCRRARYIMIILAIFVAVAVLDYSYELHNSIKQWLFISYDIYGYATIIDGDSIKIDGESIRLMHIDAPEKKQHCYLSENVRWACGLTSKFKLEEIIGQRKVKCNRIKTGYYGRTLAVCFNHDDTNINAEMVKSGMAVPYTTDNTYKTLAEAAKNVERGIWRSKFQMPWEYRKNPKKGVD